MVKKSSSLANKLTPDILFGVSRDLPRVIEMRVDDLEPNPDQPRKHFDPQALKELAESIREKGLIQPIVVKQKEGGTGFIVVAGERRWRAHKLLGLVHIPAIKTEGNPDEIAIIENIQRENLDPLEEADALAKMVERHSWTHQELSKAVGKARNTLTEVLKLNELPEIIKDEYRETGVSKSVLIEISRVKDPKEQANFWERVKKGDFQRKKIRAERTGKSNEEEKYSGSQAVTAGRVFIKKLSDIRQFERNDYENLLKVQEELKKILSNWPLSE